MSRGDARRTEVTANNGVVRGSRVEVSFDDRPFTPQEYRELYEVNPAAADLILQMGLEEQKHRHEVENKKLEITKKSQSDNYWSSFWGMLFAFVIVLAFIALVGYAFYLDLVWAGGVITGFGLVAIVRMFIAKKK